MPYISTPFLSLLIILIIRWVTSFLIVQFPRTQYMHGYFASFALGTLLGNTFINVIPDTYLFYARPLFINVLMLLGILLIFFIERILQLYDANKKTQEEDIGTKLSVFISLAIDSAAIGIAIMASFLQSSDLGQTTAFSLGFIESTKSFGNISRLLKQGLSPIEAMITSNIASLALIIAGAAIHHFHFSIMKIDHIFLPLGAGIFLYFALSSLIPEMKQESKIVPSIIQMFILIFGIGIIIFI